MFRMAPLIPPHATTRQELCREHTLCYLGAPVQIRSPYPAKWLARRMPACPGWLRSLPHASGFPRQPIGLPSPGRSIFSFCQTRVHPDKMAPRCKASVPQGLRLRRRAFRQYFNFSPATGGAWDKPGQSRQPWPPSQGEHSHTRSMLLPGITLAVRRVRFIRAADLSGACACWIIPPSIKAEAERPPWRDGERREFLHGPVGYAARPHPRW